MDGSQQPVTAIGYARTVEDLEEPPGPVDFGIDLDQSMSPRVRVLSSLVGLGGAAVVAGLVLLALGSGDRLLPLGVVAAGLLVVQVALLVERRRDPRLVLAGAALGLAVAAVLPSLPVADVGARLALALPAAVLAVLAIVIWHRIRRVSVDARIWNEAYPRLAEDPQRAVSSHLFAEQRRIGRGYVLEGNVEYCDDQGTRRSVPLSTAAALHLVLDPRDRASSQSPHVVWHCADHSVVLTRVLLA